MKKKPFAINFSKQNLKKELQCTVFGPLVAQYFIKNKFNLQMQSEISKLYNIGPFLP